MLCGRFAGKETGALKKIGGMKEEDYLEILIQNPSNVSRNVTLVATGFLGGH